MRVFLDANVLVAAFATRGLCADVVRDVLAAHELLVGEVVLAELERALTRRLRLPATTVEAILQFLREHEVVPKPKEPASLPVRDPADRWILASALAARADVLVTGDRDLLDLAASVPLRILDPRAFWELARRRR
ncbi:MAG: putative toxin-antitoxin system toxin component, PIN family [Acidobacteria bacterium]|nr:putative toxin-antitoxin system toxin component, PIN family [Acidobacteriota bacterium]